jgi:hypothetical protein
MRFRNTLGALLVVPALVTALAGQGNAATVGKVSFAGIITVVPSESGAPQQLDFCFKAVGAGCEVNAPQNGAAFGADSVGLAVDGLEGQATYVETCTAGTGLAPVGTAGIGAALHYPVGDAWGGAFGASWLRIGTVAAITGDATGVALYIPLGVPMCEAPVQVLVVGSVVLAH